MTASSLVGNTFFGLDISLLGTQLMSLRRRLSKRLLLLEFIQLRSEPVESENASRGEGARILGDGNKMGK